MTKRGIDIDCLTLSEIEQSINAAKQVAQARNGIDKDSARKIVKLIKESKLKLQAQIQQEQVRITGKKRDDLQSAMSMLKKTALGMPLQYVNFRD